MRKPFLTPEVRVFTGLFLSLLDNAPKLQHKKPWKFPTSLFPLKARKELFKKKIYFSPQTFKMQLEE